MSDFAVDRTGSHMLVFDYDPNHHLTPRVFDPVAVAVLEAARFSRGEHLLDVACGPGTVAKMARELIGPFGHVTAAEIGEEMLAASKPGAAQRELPEEVDADGNERFPHEDDTFDLVICQQGLQFAADRTRLIAEMRRVLKPTGRIAVAVWASLEQCPYFEALHRAFAESGLENLAETVAAPFSFPFATALAQELKNAGFVDVHVETVSRPLIFEEGLDHAIDAIAGTPAGKSYEELPDEQKTAFRAAATRYLKPMVWDKRVETVMVSNIGIGHNSA
ncbi:MAG: methyltransferase domain-containing protein [Candidatus Eremiobacteraeota bacterium]|nr:methyltransferase domain-containing protein [Candidatus Eremiobacteraeota bacterium]